MRNRVQLIGHLGMDPELKTFESGKKLVRVSIATNEVYRNNNGDKVTDTEWHNLVAWGKTAEIINEYTKKGSELAVEGKLTTNTYEDKDGNKRTNTEILVNDVVL
jgi:single-strand DNA-binding protein